MVRDFDNEGVREAKSEIVRIRALCDRRLPRYHRNFARYCNVQEPRTAVTNLQDIDFTFAFYAGDVDLYSTYNVIKSCTDTLVSKISQSKVRPFFNTVDGSFRTRKVCLNAQKFFDIYFDNQDLYGSMPEVARDALLFDFGAIWVDDESFRIRRVPPWWVYVDPYEYANGSVTKCFIRIPYFPTQDLRRIIKENADLDGYGAKVEVCYYYDLTEKTKYIFVNGSCAKKKSVGFDTPPIELLYWSRSLKGFFTTSAADDIYTLQVRIDETERFIKEAYEKSVKHMLLVADKSNVKASTLNNSPDTVVTFTATPTSYPPVQAFTPPPIDGAYEVRLQRLIQSAYEMYGISSLSAQSKKPTGQNSGIALQTLQDVESERFNVFLSEYINMYSRVAKKCIDIFPDESEIIDDPRITGYTWGDMKSARKLYQVQFSSAHVLSKDPSEKIKQIQQLMAMGYVDGRTAANLLELPDIERTYNISNASNDYCETIIERALTTKKVDAWSEVVDLDMLISITANYIMRLDIVNAPPDEIEILTALLKQAMSIKDSAIKATQPAEEPVPAPPAGTMPPMPEAVPPIAQTIPQGGIG